MMNQERERLERFRRNEPGAFDDLYAEYGPRIYRFSLRLCGNSSDAEDVTQEVFVAAYRNLHNFEGRSSLSTYLYRIAVYQWRQMRTGNRVETVSWEEHHQHVNASSDPSHTTLSRIELMAALAALPEAQRAAFLLVKAEGLTCREAAEALGSPVGTVKYHVFEAIVRLRAYLGGATDVKGSLPQREAFDAV